MKKLSLVISILMFISLFSINPFFINKTSGDNTFNIGLWNIETVDGGGVGWYTDISILDSEEVYITYYDVNAKNLKLAKLINSKWYLETIDSIGDVGMYTSLAIDNNRNPHISYYDETNGNLKYAKWADQNWSIEIVDNYNDVGLDTSIAIDSNNYPHISYYDSSDGDLKYAKWTGSEWIIEVVDSLTKVGLGTSLVLDDSGNPHISYYYEQAPGLSYAYRSESGWITNIIDSECKSFGYTSITLDTNSRPNIAYFDVGTTTEDWYLKYAYFNNSKWNIEIIDPNIKSFWNDPGLSIGFGKNEIIHISYYEWSENNLNYAWRLNDKWNIETVDSYGAVGAYNSIDIDSEGYPHISYMDRSNLSLKYAKKYQYCPSTPKKPFGNKHGFPGREYIYTSSSIDFENDKIRYGWDWNGDFIIDEYTEYLNSGEKLQTSHIWENGGTYQIQLIAIDENNLESRWSDSLAVSIPKNKLINYPPNPPIIDGPLIGKVNDINMYNFTVIDPDEDDALWELEIDFGNEIITVKSCDHGECKPWNNGETIPIEHIWKESGNYDIKAKVMDAYGEWSEWSEPYTVTMPRFKTNNLINKILILIFERLPFH